jgi:hypothetical protein
MYDPEYWPATPLPEQQNPATYMQQFGQLAHANGLKVIEAPGRDLGLVPGAACPQARGENLDHWYLRCNLPGAAALSADMVVIQDQVNTTNPAEFDYLYTTAAKSAHPDGIYINATTSTLGRTRAFLNIMQAAGY